MKRFTVLFAVIIAVLSLNGPVCASAAAETETETEITQGEEISRDLLKRLCRSELDGLGEIDGPIYVFGHQSPDTDTVCTSIAYAYILRELGYDAQPAVLGKINHETAYILDAAGVEVPPVLEDAAGKNVVLIDHSEYSQSADGLKDANVIMIIDHHGDGSVTTGNQLIYDARPLGATAVIAWIRSILYGVKLDRQTSLLLLGAVLSDTRNLLSSSTEADREAVRILSEKAGIRDVDAFYSEMFKASLSYEGMSDDEILTSDMKKYETEESAFIIGAVNVYDEAQARAIAGRMKKVLPAVVSLHGAEFGYAQISVYHDDIDVNYIVPSDEMASGLLDTAFGEAGEWENGVYRLEPGVSRRKVLVPRLTDALSLHPGE